MCWRIYWIVYLGPSCLACVFIFGSTVAMLVGMAAVLYAVDWLCSIRSQPFLFPPWPYAYLIPMLKKHEPYLLTKNLLVCYIQSVFAQWDGCRYKENRYWDPFINCSFIHSTKLYLKRSICKAWQGTVYKKCTREEYMFQDLKDLTV